VGRFGAVLKQTGQQSLTGSDPNALAIHLAGIPPTKGRNPQKTILLNMLDYEADFVNMSRDHDLLGPASLLDANHAAHGIGSNLTERGQFSLYDFTEILLRSGGAVRLY